MAFQNAKRRSRQAQNGGRGFTKAQWNKLLDRCGNICAYCRIAPASSIDHFVPLSGGGKHDFSNLIPACRSCNSLKGEKDPRTWILERFGEERLAFVRSIRLRKR